MTVKKYLDLAGLTVYDSKIKEYIKELKDVEVYNDLNNFPQIGKEGIIYLASFTSALYAWSNSINKNKGGYYRIGLSQETLSKIEFAYNNSLLALEHSNIKDGSNPHKTTYNNIVDIPLVATSEDIDSLIKNI